MSTTNTLGTVTTVSVDWDLYDRGASAAVKAELDRAAEAALARPNPDLFWTVAARYIHLGALDTEISEQFSALWDEHLDADGFAL